MLNSLLIQETPDPGSLSAILHKVLTFIYFIAHQLGLWIIKLIQYLVPDAQFAENVIDALGFLVILTLFMFLVGVAKKIAWVIVCVGWVLLLIRILIIVFKLG
ncbi:MAG: hypothetical protein A2W03_10695 [Candidatus Aminicenantes bacterium RBG_16_63_16]|nr:MAG: hypothetical protein A2W03_10695 [Candidatus Aminicenantes bacterium RBG_16_63_16]